MNGTASFVDVAFTNDEGETETRFEDCYGGKLDLSNATMGQTLTLENPDFSEVVLDGIHGPSNIALSIRSNLLRIEGLSFQDATLDTVSMQTGASSINFAGAEITGEVTIGRESAAAEVGSVTFDGATFHEPVSFQDVHFARKAPNVEGGNFHAHLTMQGCTFKNPLHIRALGKEPPSFSLADCTFERGLHLEGEGPSHRLFKDAKEVDLSNLTFESDCTVSLRNVDLSQTRFGVTDVRDVEFTGVKWDRQGGPYGLTRQAVYDERAEDASDDSDYRKVERLCRELKENFEGRKNWYDAGQFHIGEKEMQREATDSWARRWMLGIYRWVSLYGERALPAFIALIITLVAFSFLYIGVGLRPEPVLLPSGETIKYGYLQFWANTWDETFWSWGSSFNYAIQHIGIGRATGYVLDSGGQILTVLQRLISTTLVALAALAIRQQMKR